MQCNWTSGIARMLVALAFAAGSTPGWDSGARAQAGAESYPSRPIRIIVPFPPGGSVDTLARVVGQRMQENWGQTVVVENRGGGSTMIGTAAAAAAEPDGHTLVIVVSNHATNPALQSKMQYDALKDFEFISMMARAPIILYANPKFPPNNLKDLVALAKEKPGSLNFASAGLGSMTHLTGETFKSLSGIDKTHILYRGGTPAMNDLLAGQIPMQYGTVAQALPQYKAGLLKALAISSAARYPSVPEIPTFREQGFDVVTTEWFGLLAPAKTPKPIVAKLNAEIRRIMALPNMGDRLSAIELTSSTPEELKAFIASEIDRWAPVIKKLGLKVE